MEIKKPKRRGILPIISSTLEDGFAASNQLKQMEIDYKMDQVFDSKGKNNTQPSSENILDEVNQFLAENFDTNGGEGEYDDVDEQNIQILQNNEDHQIMQDSEDLLNTNAYGFDDDYEALGLLDVDDEEDFESYNYDDLLTNKSISHFKEIFNRSGRKRYPTDSQNPVNPFLPVPDDPKLIKTKQMLAIRVSEIQASAGLSDKTVLLFLVLWNEYCPGMDLPILPMGTNGNFKLDTEKYTLSDDRKYKVHCCPMGCTAYMGDRALDIVCDVCKSPRFRPCTDESHNENPLAACSCNPFTGGHSFKGRIPFRSFFYRPMLPLFQSMDKWARDQDNNVFKFNESRMIDGNLNDILDGSNPKSNIEDMHRIFCEKKSKNDNLIEVSFVLSEFYDGGTLFNRGAKSIWPLAVSILNCNPTDRMDYGIGLFMIILHDLKIGSAVENAIFTQLLIPELQLLRRGVEYSYIDDSGNKIEIFLQVRLVVHIMDTVALTKKANLYGHNSAAGCLICFGMYGCARGRTCIKRMINIGHRAWLRRNHCFRRFGVSKFCCPCGYTKGNKDTVNEVIDLLNKFKYSNGPSKTTQVPIMVTVEESLLAYDTRVELSKVSIANRDTAIAKYHENIRVKKKRVNQKKLALATPFIYQEPCRPIDASNEVDTTLNNRDFKLSDFQNSLWFAHCDFREITYMRRPNRFYRGDNSNVFSNEINDNDSGDDGGEEEIDSEKFPVKSPWSFDSLPSARIENSLCYGPFHALMNLAILIISLLIGLAGTDFSVLKLCIAEGRLPFLDCRMSEAFEKEIEQVDAANITNKNTSSSSTKATKKPSKHVNNTAASNRFTRNIPYLLSNEYQQRSDAFHNCIIIPKGEKTSFGSKNILTGSSNLKGNDKIQYISVFINFDLLFTDLHPDYKAFFALTSSVVSDMIAPTISAVNVHDNLRDLSTVDDLFDRVIEMISAFEGYFPDAVQNFTTHELVDIVKSIKKFGPLQSWWEYPGERFMKIVKDCCPIGGVSHTLTMHALYAIKELNKRFRYMPPVNKLDNIGRYRDNHIKIEWKSAKELSNQLQNYYIMNELILAVYNFMATEVIENKHIISPFYRVFTIYKNSTQLLDEKLMSFIAKYYKDFTSIKPSFYLWIQMLVFNDFNKKLYNSMITDNLVESISEADLNNANIFECDKQCIIEIYNMSPKLISFKACVKGIDMNARGLEFCETTESVQAEIHGHTIHHPVNRFNHLNKQWSFTKQSMCWAKFKQWTLKKDIAGVWNCEYKTGYGQTNFFFRINLPSDPVVHNLPFANLTARNTLQHNVLKRDDSKVFIPYMDVYDESLHPAGRLNVEIFDQQTQLLGLNQVGKAMRKKERDDINSLEREYSSAPKKPTYDIDMPQFFCLSRFYSTKVALCGITKAGTHWIPILVDASKAESCNHDKYYTRDVDLIERLYLIDLHPQRKNVEISFKDSKIIEEHK